MSILGVDVDPGTVLAIAALVGVPLATSQLIATRRATQLEAVSTVWRNFDDPSMRAARRHIHEGIPVDPKGRPDPSMIAPDLLASIETTATALDRVGTLLAHRLIPEALVFERYGEVVIPLWEKIQPYIDAQRVKKGGGWRFVGPPLGIDPSTRPFRAPWAIRHGDLYTWACSYRDHHHPHERYGSFQPVSEAPEPQGDDPKDQAT